MRQFNQLVFEEFVMAVNTPYYTDPNWNPLLGAAEKLVIEAVVDQVAYTGSAPALLVNIEHSADNRNFKTKNAAQGNDLNLTGLLTSATNSAVATDPQSPTAPGIPTAAYARLNIQLTTATTASAHVKIWVTGRAEQ